MNLSAHIDCHIDLTAETLLADAVRPVPAGPGVGLFADEADHPILLLPSARLRSLVRRRLTPTDGGTARRTDLAAITRRAAGCPPTDRFVARRYSQTSVVLIRTRGFSAVI